MLNRRGKLPAKTLLTAYGNLIGNFPFDESNLALSPSPLADRADYLHIQKSYIFIML